MNSELKQDLSGITPEMVFEAVKAFRLDKEPREAMYDALAAALAVKSSAAQEAVAYLDIGSGGYLDIGSDLPEEQLLALPNGRHALGIIGTYGIDGYVSAPVTAAPTDLISGVLSDLAAVAGSWIVEAAGPSADALNDCAAKMLEAIEQQSIKYGLFDASTPAAPGIGLSAAHQIAFEIGGDDEGGYQFTAEELEQFVTRLIDASPKGELESWKRGTKACAEVLGQVMRQTQDSPKGGSDALDATRLDWLDANGFTAYRQIDPIDGLSPHCVVVHETQLPRRGNVHDTIRGAIDAAMQAQAGDAEVQP